MTDSLDSVDLNHLQLIRRIHARLDPVPAGLVDRCKFALSVQALHAEVAELISTAPAMATRSTTDFSRTETVTFSSTNVSIMITIARDVDGLVITGWVTEPGSRVELLGDQGSRDATADEQGRFRFEQVTAGPTHFVVWPADPGSDRPPVITPTIDL